VKKKGKEKGKKKKPEIESCLLEKNANFESAERENANNNSYNKNNSGKKNNKKENNEKEIYENANNEKENSENEICENVKESINFKCKKEREIVITAVLGIAITNEKKTESDFCGNGTNGNGMNENEREGKKGTGEIGQYVEKSRFLVWAFEEWIPTYTIEGITLPEAAERKIGCVREKETEIETGIVDMDI
jgi:hypothetical protein